MCSVIFEVARSQAWVEGGPESIIPQAQARLRSHGWDAVRQAISITIRCAVYLLDLGVPYAETPCIPEHG